MEGKFYSLYNSHCAYLSTYAGLLRPMYHFFWFTILANWLRAKNRVLRERSVNEWFNRHGDQCDPLVCASSGNVSANV
jgi:hypothetical protein